MKVRINENDKIQVLNSTDLYPIMQKILLRQDKIRRRKEYSWIIGLETDNTINFIELVGLGDLSSVIMPPREIFRIAVIKNVEKVILCHNHPSGNLTPSLQDRIMTDKLQEGGKLLGITIEDHLIISEEKYFSFANKGYI